MFIIMAGISTATQYLVYHLCVYKNRPSDDDLLSLKEELKTNKDFGLHDIDNLEFRVEEVISDVDFDNISKADIDKFIEQLKNK